MDSHFVQITWFLGREDIFLGDAGCSRRIISVVWNRAVTYCCQKQKSALKGWPGVIDCSITIVALHFVPSA